MNDGEHTFPMPETARHKLDDVKEEMVHPKSRRLRREFQQDPWPVMALAAATGLLFGLMLRRR